MSIRLEAVKLNFDPGSAITDALSIRRNAAEAVPIPEWQFGISRVPEDSPAAYSILGTRGKTISIEVQFRAMDPQLIKAEIRAVDPSLGVLSSILKSIIPLPIGNILGEVRAREVNFPSGGLTGFERFELRNVAIQNAGVGIWATVWQWQYRLEQGAWTDFETSYHRIYVVVDMPNAPWGQANIGGNLQLPWTEVLDYACYWAVGAKNVNDAAAQVTRGVNNLGGGVITYDCPGGGKTHYCTSRKFYCSRFLELLKGVGGNGIYVNCTDCASIVSTFSNVLGANLSQSRMEASYGGSFRLNPVTLIGSTAWKPCFKAFSFHDVAWNGTCSEADEVFDACLQVDGDMNPTAPPHVPLLPVNLKFGKVGAMLYLDRLVDPADRLGCQPSHLCERRAVL